MLDLKKNDPAKAAEVGYTFTVVMPDGTETDAKITVRGANSAIVKNYSRRIYQEFKQREIQAKRRGREPDELTLEEVERLAAESAAVRVIDWQGIAEDGKELKFSREEAERVFREYPFIREQVMTESDNVFNFRTDKD